MRTKPHIVKCLDHWAASLNSRVSFGTTPEDAYRNLMERGMSMDQTYLKLNHKTQCKLYNTVVVALFKKETGLDYREFLRREMRKSIGFSKKFLEALHGFSDSDMEIFCKAFIDEANRES